MKHLFGEKQNGLKQWVVAVSCAASVGFARIWGPGHRAVRITMALGKVSCELDSLLFSYCEMIQQHYW